MPIKTVAEAIREAQEQLLRENPNVFIMGEGVPDPKAVFGTTLGLRDKFRSRVFDMPVAENGGVGVCIGAAVAGMRPIFITQRADFLLYAADQIINNAAKWWGMFGGRAGACPLVIRAIVGRGWGQGMQHSQHLENLFSRVKGLNVWCPSNAYDAKGMLIAAVRGSTPTIIFEHRWVHELKCEVPDEMYEVHRGSVSPRFSSGPILAAWGYMVHVCRKAQELAARQGISNVTVIDLQGPPQIRVHGMHYIEEADNCPPSPGLSENWYPNVCAVGRVLQSAYPYLDLTPFAEYDASRPHDIPDANFRGPF